MEGSPVTSTANVNKTTVFGEDGVVYCGQNTIILCLEAILYYIIIDTDIYEYNYLHKVFD